MFEERFLKACSWLREGMGLEPNEAPFPWQENLLKRFLSNELPNGIDIPTGLGKTSVIAIWLVARTLGAPLPRRLVYVVDRRAVVDQATDVAVNLRRYVDQTPELKAALGLGDRSLPISTLRGKHIDNREWLEDPALPAIVVGTVDMIGSRLLFEGYGVSRKLRPYQAGLLGADVLLVLDEAHLVPPFERLVNSIANDAALGPRGDLARQLVPRFRMLPLSATARQNDSGVLNLSREDLEHPVVYKRLTATKRLRLTELPEDQELPEALAEAAWKACEQGQNPLRLVIFSDSPKIAEAAKQRLEAKAKSDAKLGISKAEIATELLVGARRVFERQRAAKWLKREGFLASSKVKPSKPAFLFATSAGEVGVDLDANHMVADLVAWDRMIQRLGRVNRRGDGEATVIVFHEALKKPTEAKGLKDYERNQAWLQAVKCLPAEEDAYNGSPGAIQALKNRAAAEDALRAILEAGTTPTWLHPALTRALADAWAMTSLKEHTGRPKIGPWLRGWDSNPPQTSVVWRKYLPVHSVGPPDKAKIEDFFEAAPPHFSETLETETSTALSWVIARAKAVLARAKAKPKQEYGKVSQEAPALLRPDDVVAYVLGQDGGVQRPLTLRDLDLDGDEKEDKKKQKGRLADVLAASTLVVDSRLGGLHKDGRLSNSEDSAPVTVDEPWPNQDNEHPAVTPWEAGLIEENAELTDSNDRKPTVAFRVRQVDSAAELSIPAGSDWKLSYSFATHLSNEGEELRWLVVDKWRENSSNEEARSAGTKQSLKEHQEWAEKQVKEIGARLNLPQDYIGMLAIAARLHDEGKQSPLWQRAFNAPPGGPYAKTPGPIKFALLDGYRHEFGSLGVAETDSSLLALPEEMKDLALHLIAAHHGFARPSIRINGCEDAPPSALEERAKSVALRFARLQKRWGPWGLAWWEALLRAADQQASRDNEEKDSKDKRGKSQ